jgi:hypothetical protein
MYLFTYLLTYLLNHSFIIFDLRGQQPRPPNLCAIAANNDAVTELCCMMVGCDGVHSTLCMVAYD